MKKKLLSVILALALCLGLLPAAALAAGENAFPGDICTRREWEVVTGVNRERLKEGLQPVSIFAGLQGCADIREEELVEYYSHTRPNGTDCFTVLDETGMNYSRAGENIAYGYTSAASVMQGWMDSAGHRGNILNADYTHIGAGNKGTHWAQMFIGSRGCGISQLSLSRTGLICTGENSVEDLGLYLTAQCPVHGACYLPVLEEMCTGFDPSDGGLQTVTVSYGGQSARFQVWKNPFPDVPAGEYYTEPVAWAVEQGIINGRDDGRFDPHASCNQQEIILMLWRAAGCPAADKAPVGADDFAAGAVNWAYAQGMVDAGFERYAPCTRATAVNWIWKSHGAQAGGSATFPDVPAQYAAPVAWAVAKGVTYGNDAGNFDPDGICSRAQIVTFLYRAK